MKPVKNPPAATNAREGVRVQRLVGMRAKPELASRICISSSALSVQPLRSHLRSWWSAASQRPFQPFRPIFQVIVPPYSFAPPFTTSTASLTVEFQRLRSFAADFPLAYPASRQTASKVPPSSNSESGSSHSVFSESFVFMTHNLRQPLAVVNRKMQKSENTEEKSLKSAVVLHAAPLHSNKQLYGNKQMPGQGKL